MATASPSMPPSPAARSQTGPNWNGIVILIGIALSLIVVATIALLWFFNGQAVAGEEFCPQTFQVRDFYYRRLPWVKSVVSPTKLSLRSSPVSTAVLRHIQRLPDERWDIVEVSEGFQVEARSPKILIQSLSPSTSSGAFWDSWSIQHTDLAAVTWPIVQQAAVLQAYEIVPDILESALELSKSSSRDPAELTKRWQPTLDGLKSK